MNKKLILTLCLFAAVGVLFGVGLVSFFSPKNDQKQRHMACKAELLDGLKNQYKARDLTLEEKNLFHDIFSNKEYTTYLLKNAKGEKVEGKALVIMSGSNECSSEERSTP